MAFLRMKYREDAWFVGGLLLAAVLGIIAGITLNIVFLAAVNVPLVFVWLALFLYCITTRRPGPSVEWLMLAILMFIATTWLAVVVSVWGYYR